MSSKRHLAAVMAVVTLFAAVALPGAVAADDHDAPDLEIDVVQDDEIVIAVTANESPAANATVDVAVAEENATYAGAGEYVTDADGAVTLEPPAETVTVAIEATAGNATGETTATLEAAEEEADGFGALVSAFVERVRGDTDGPLGLVVSNFVVDNNPGNAPDHAGPPEHAGPASDDERERGPPAHAGQSDHDGNESAGGPPSHAGTHDDDGEHGGPPSHAGPASDD